MRMFGCCMGGCGGYCVVFRRMNNLNQHEHEQEQAIMMTKQVIEISRDAYRKVK